MNRIVRASVLTVLCSLGLQPTAATAQATTRDSAIALYRQASAALHEKTRDGNERALSLLVLAAPLFHGLGSPTNEAVMLNGIGSISVGLGRPDSALVYYRRALSIRREIGDREGIGETIHNIAFVFADLGGQDSALAYYQQALAIRREAGDRAGEAGTLNNIGTSYQRLGRLDSALAYYRPALAIVRAVGDRLVEGRLLNNISDLYLTLGVPDSVLAYSRLAIALSQEIGDRAGEGSALHNIAYVIAILGGRDSALVYYRRVLAIRREVGDRAGEGETLNNIASTYDKMGHPDSALAYYQQALGLMRETEDREGEATTLSNIGVLYHVSPGLRDLRRAVAYYDSAASLVAQIRKQAGGDANSISFAEAQGEFFRRWAFAWLDRSGEVGEGPSALASLATAERGRAQALLDLMGRTSTGIRPGADLAAEGRQLVRSVQESGAALLGYLVSEDTLLIWFASPVGELRVAAVAVSQDSITRLVRVWRAGLGADEAAGQTQLAARGSPPLESPTRSGTASASDPVGGGTSVDAGTRLAAFLLPPEVFQGLGPGSELVILPQGPLTLVPFAALPLSRGELGTGNGDEEDHEVLGGRFALRYAPSLASVVEAESRAGLPEPARMAALKRSLVVGNPSMPLVTHADGSRSPLAPLSGAEAEGRWVAGQFGTTALTGPRASEAVVRARLGGATVVHLATHGYAYASEAQARNSFVALAPDSTHDGLLTVGEVLDDPDLKLSADLVVLSACQTGLGDLKQAEGTVGLQRAFLAKGARSVLVSLWSVSDEATSLLMKGFYAHWLNDPDHPSKAEALRRAQAEVRGTPGSRSYEPRYWAAFQLVGAR